MKTTDERMRQVLQRASVTQAIQHRRRQRLATWVGGVSCIVVLVAVSMVVASVGDADSLVGFSVGESGLAASVFSDSPALGYFIVGFLGAVLGAMITILAYRLGNDRRAGVYQRGSTADAGSYRIGEAGESVASDGNEDHDANAPGAIDVEDDARGHFAP